MRELAQGDGRYGDVSSECALQGMEQMTQEKRCTNCFHALEQDTCGGETLLECEMAVHIDWDHFINKELDFYCSFWRAK